MRDLVIIGGGPAGMSAAIAAYESGISDVLILERDEHLGGILQQCIHNGFGLHKFGEELTGPEYAWKYEEKIHALGIEHKLNTMVLDISKEKIITASIYKIDKLVEKPLAHQAPSNLAIMGRYVLSPDIFDKIDETEPGVGGEIQLTDALQKLDSIYGVTFEGKTYDIGNRLEWLKTSIEFAMDDAESKKQLIEYMKEIIEGEE